METIKQIIAAIRQIPAVLEQIQLILAKLDQLRNDVETVRDAISSEVTSAIGGTMATLNTISKQLNDVKATVNRFKF
jgi:prefoldin subunit 5